MKTVRFYRYGGPEVLTYEDAPDPQPGPGGVLVTRRGGGHQLRRPGPSRRRSLSGTDAAAFYPGH